MPSKAMQLLLCLREEWDALSLGQRNFFFFAIGSSECKHSKLIKGQRIMGLVSAQCQVRHIDNPSEGSGNIAEDGETRSEMLFSGYDMAAAPTDSQQLWLFAQD